MSNSNLTAGLRHLHDKLALQRHLLVKSATAAALLSKTKMATAILLVVSLLTGAGLWARHGRTIHAVASPPPAAQDTAEKSKPQTPRREKKQGVKIGGRVLDPDGKPVRAARLYLPLLRGEQLRPLATTDAAGRFDFTVMPADVWLNRRFREPWHYVHVLAAADGYGPGITAVGDLAESEKLTIRLAKDDVPIEGRILDLQGKPIAGVTVRVDGIGVPKKGDLTAFLDDLKNRLDGFPAETNFLTTMYHEDFARLRLSATTDKDGRFRIEGIGGERIAQLMISGPTIETRQVRVRTRLGATIDKLAWASSPDGDHLIYYGAAFEYVAAPTKPIIGVVRDQSTGQPLANATIHGYKLPGILPRGSIRTITDKDGRYRLTGMPKGDGNAIEVVPPEGSAYRSLRHPVENTLGLDPVTIDFGLRRGVRIKGRVTDKKTGAGVEAFIKYCIFSDTPFRKEFQSHDPLYHRQITTEADGSFHMVVPPGHALLAARAIDGKYLAGMGAEKIKRLGNRDILLTDPLLGLMAFDRFLEIDPAKDVQTLTCHLDLDPGRTLPGTIVGPDGKPLNGAHIRGLRSSILPSWEPESLKTAKFTAYALTPARPRNLLVIHEGKQLAGSLLVRGDEKEPVTIKLRPWGTVTGRLVTDLGTPYTKGDLNYFFPVRVDKETIGSHPLLRIPRDKSGRFRIEGLVPGLKYNLGIREGSKGVEVFQNLTIRSGETKDVGDVIIKPRE